LQQTPTKSSPNASQRCAARSTRPDINTTTIRIPGSSPANGGFGRLNVPELTIELAKLRSSRSAGTLRSLGLYGHNRRGAMSRTRVLVTASVMIGVLLGVFGGAAGASATSDA